jgi:sugar lactone lactonase YvrE
VIDTPRWHAELVVDAHARLGEGPVWCAGEQVLYWVDIDLGRIHRFDPATGRDAHMDVGEPVGAVTPTRSGGLVLAAKSGFAQIEAWLQPPQRLAEVEADRLETRMNDGACDSRGRFWAGTMHVRADPGHGSLYRLDQNGTVTLMVQDVSISNGIAWSPDDTVMYYVDTPSGGVDAFDFDREDGTISNRRRMIDVARADGQPDGLVVDAEGHLWLALWDGWSVRRYRPDGVVVAVVGVPCARVMKCAFGGPGLNALYITTASPDAPAADQPHAGGLFLAHPGVTGLPATPFAG